MAGDGISDHSLGTRRLGSETRSEADGRKIARYTQKCNALGANRHGKINGMPNRSGRQLARVIGAEMPRWIVPWNARRATAIGRL